MIRIFFIFSALLSVAAAGFLALSGFSGTEGEGSFPPERACMERGKKNFRVAVFSDFTDNLKSMEAVAEAINAEKPDFVLCLGDMVRRAEHADFRYVERKIRNSFKVPVYTVPGNWDRQHPGEWRNYREAFGADYYFFSYGDTLFLALNTADKELSPEQLRFAELILETERPKFARCVIFCHVPPRDPKEVGGHSMTEKGAGQMSGILKKYPVDLLLCGHIHWFSDTFYAGRRMITTPSSGQEIRDPENPMFGFVLLDFRADGGICAEQRNVTPETGGDGAPFFREVILKRFCWRIAAFAILCAGLSACALLFRKGWRG